MARQTDTPQIDKSELSHPEPRRIRDREHVRFVTKQPCLICGRTPSDPHHVRFAQHRALGRKVSDEFTVPLCRGHHREVHRCGDEAAWWRKSSIDPITAARTLWLKTNPLPTAKREAGGINDAGAEAAASLAFAGVDTALGARYPERRTDANVSSGFPMTSLRQIAANRRNASKSTGPRTDEGKDRSRCNAVRP